ncbi:fatty acid desaturase 6 [Lissotriton helveticus]
MQPAGAASHPVHPRAGEGTDPPRGPEESSRALPAKDTAVPDPCLSPEEVTPREEVSLEQSPDGCSSAEEGCFREESDQAPDKESTPSPDPPTPEQVLLRWRNRQQRGLGPASEEGVSRGGPGTSRSTSPPSIHRPASEKDEEKNESAAPLLAGGPIGPCPRSPPDGASGEEPLMGELSAMVQALVKSSSWWERHGFDCALIAVAFLVLPAGFVCLRSDNILLFLCGITILGAAHSTITVKGSHLASHGALAESKRWRTFWAAFFIEVCSAFPAQVGAYNHVKLHHAHTNIIGLGDSSVWKIPALNRWVYMFLAPLALPIITPLAALGFLKEMTLQRALRTLGLICLGLCGHCALLLVVSGFQTLGSALLCMFLTRAVLAVPFIHVNIFQHIGLAMFAPEERPKRILQMSHGVLNLSRNHLLDWTFGHSLISCHVEHHLFPHLSDNMCLKIKPIVSKYLLDKKLPYHEDTYLSRLQLFLDRYEELMVHLPPITQLVGIQ